MSSPAATSNLPDRREVLAWLRPWAGPEPVRSTVDLLVGWTLALGALFAMRRGVDTGLWAALVPLELIYGMASIKLFLLQHDGGHGCAWRGRRGNAFFALLAGVPANITPSVWKADHDRHHAHSNDLDHPQDGQTAALTVAELDALHPILRWGYALVTSLPVFYTFGPPFLFFVRMRALARPHENLAQALWFFGLWKADLLWLHLLAFWPVGAFGFLVFHAQHTFDGVYKARGPDHDRFVNGMLGSSLLVFPWFGPMDPAVRYLLHGVSNHHIHHLNTAIPGHRLDACQLASGDRFDATPRVTLGDALRTAHYSVYDEASGRFEAAWRHLLGRPPRRRGSAIDAGKGP